MATSILSRKEDAQTESVTSQDCLSICLVGGIYGKDEAYRAKCRMTPETLLEDALRARGHYVVTRGHRELIPSQKHSQNIDIIHVHHSGIAGLLAATDVLTAAFVYTSHDGAAMAGLPKSISRRAADRFILSRADAVVALSRAESDFQLKNYPMKGAIQTVIPNGIDTKNYHYLRRNRAGRDQRWQLLFVGQLIEIKGVDRLIRALALLPRNIELLLAFHFDAERKNLEKLARQLGVQDYVHFLGIKTPDELRALYQSADLFVLPSFAEALPNVLTEAMLCGTPVVATDVGGVRDQLGGYGIVVPPEETGAIARAIGDVLTRYGEFNERGEAMSQYAMQRFSVSAMVESHLELYRSLLKPKTTRRRNLDFKRPMNMAARLGVKVLCKT